MRLTSEYTELFPSNPFYGVPHLSACAALIQPIVPVRLLQRDVAVLQVFFHQLQGALQRVAPARARARRDLDDVVRVQGQAAHRKASHPERLINLVMSTYIKQYDDFATTSRISFNRKHNAAIVTTATGA